MTMRVGSVVFGSNGMPGVVKSADPLKAEFQIDTNRDEIARIHRHGYINGLSEDEREHFNSSLDKIKEIEDPSLKLDAMKKIVDESKADPKNMRITRYLESEYFHMMQVYNISPRYYSAKVPVNPQARNT